MTAPVVIAGLDLSLRAAGVAIFDVLGQAHYYTVGYDLKKGSSERLRVERLVTVTNGVMKVLHHHGVQFVGIENYGFAGHGAAFQGELQGNVKVQLWCGMKLVPVVIPPMTVRKYLLGKATKDKKVVRRHLESMGYPPTSNTDESDALAVAVVVRDYVCRRESISDVEKMDLFDRLDRQR